MQPAFKNRCLRRIKHNWSKNTNQSRQNSSNLTFLIFLTIGTVLFFNAVPTVAQITQYPICSSEVAKHTKCGKGANCILVEGSPGCVCGADMATGITLSGNPYIACTFDMSGYWQLFSPSIPVIGGGREAVVSPVSNEPFIVRFDRTDTLLQTHYMLGAVFAATGITSFALGVCSKLLIDVTNNKTAIMQYAEGYLDDRGRGILLRTPNSVTSLFKEVLQVPLIDRVDLRGIWEKENGDQVSIKDLYKPLDLDGFFHSRAARDWSSYWYDDSSFSDGLLSETVALFHDRTKGFEKKHLQSKSTFVQAGWLGLARFGSRRIDIFSAKTGLPAFVLLNIRSLPTVAFTPITPQMVANGDMNGGSLDQTTEGTVTARGGRRRMKNVHSTDIFVDEDASSLQASGNSTIIADSESAAPSSFGNDKVFATAFEREATVRDEKKNFLN